MAAAIRAARSRRVLGWALVAAAAAAALVVGTVSVAVARGCDDETVVAAARLAPLAAAERATARLVESDGHLQLDLPLPRADLPPPAGFYEVWLIDTKVQRLISLGPVRPDATLLAGVAFVAFLGAALLARRVPALDGALDSALAAADAGSTALVLAIAFVNAVAEEHFFAAPCPSPSPAIIGPRSRPSSTSSSRRPRSTSRSSSPRP